MVVTDMFHFLPCLKAKQGMRGGDGVNSNLIFLNTKVSRFAQ